MTVRRYKVRRNKEINEMLIKLLDNKVLVYTDLKTKPKEVV